MQVVVAEQAGRAAVYLSRTPVTLPSVCRCFSLSAIRRLHPATSQGTMNVTHHQAPIFALTLPSLVVDSLADPFKRTSQSVDFIFEDNR
jgi:hypothetical protein